MTNNNNYMVTFELPEYFSQEFIELIPAQRAQINRWLTEGVIRFYTLDMEKSTLWTVISAKDENGVRKVIEEMPLSDYLHSEVRELMFYSGAEHVMQFSLN